MRFLYERFYVEENGRRYSFSKDEYDYFVQKKESESLQNFIDGHLPENLTSPFNAPNQR